MFIMPKQLYGDFLPLYFFTGTVSQNLLTITGTVSQNLLTRATHTWMGLQLASFYIFIQHFDAFLSWVISLVHNCFINFIAYIFGTIFPLDKCTLNHFIIVQVSIGLS